MKWRRARVFLNSPARRRAVFVCAECAKLLFVMRVRCGAKERARESDLVVGCDGGEEGSEAGRWGPQHLSSERAFWGVWVLRACVLVCVVMHAALCDSWLRARSSGGWCGDSDGSLPHRAAKA